MLHRGEWLGWARFCGGIVGGWVLEAGPEEPFFRQDLNSEPLGQPNFQPHLDLNENLILLGW